MSRQQSYDWRDDIEASDEFFVYRADLWCRDDGEAIRAKLTKAGKAPADPADEYSYDSDDFPRGPYAPEEADSPQHCAAGAKCINAIVLPDDPYGKPLGRIGQWLANSLTPEDGVEETCQIVLADMDSANEHARAVGRLWRHLYSNQLDDCGGLVEVKSLKRDSGAEALDVLLRADKSIVNRIYLDLDALYAVGFVGDPRQMELGGVSENAGPNIGVWRSFAQPDGFFEKPEVVIIPAVEGREMFRGVDPKDVVAQMIEDEAWEGVESEAA